MCDCEMVTVGRGRDGERRSRKGELRTALKRHRGQEVNLGPEPSMIYL